MVFTMAISTIPKMIWYFGCILFCIHCLSLHLDERSAVTYSSVDQNESFNMLGCFPLSRLIGRREKQIDLDRLNEKVNFFFNKSRGFVWLRTHRSDEMESEIFSQISRKNYLLLNERFCFVREDRFSIVFEGNGLKSLGLTYVAFKSDTWDSQELPGLQFFVGHMIVVIREEHQCNYSKIRCLNNCFKERQKLSRYLYEGNESGWMLRQYDEHDRAMIEHEHGCFERCKRDSCKLVYFRSSQNFERLNSFKEPLPTRVRVTKAYLLKSDSEFIIQFIGIICFFANNSLAELFFKPIRLVVLKFRRTKRFASFYLLFKKIVLFAILNYCVILYAQMIAYHIYRLDNPMKKETTNALTQPEPLSLAICVDLENVLEVGLLRRLYIPLNILIFNPSSKC